MAMRKRLTVAPIFSDLDPKNPIANAANRKKYPWLEKVAEDMRRSAGYGAFKGADAMRGKILDSPTGSSWHKAINRDRGNPPGARFETGTMYNSVSRTYGRIVPSRDARKRGSVTASFGWPADADGIIKDAPSAPKGRMPDGPGWRDDPKYFLMQEYGFDNEGRSVPGMRSQAAGVEAAKKAIQEELKRRGYK